MREHFHAPHCISRLRGGLFLLYVFITACVCMSRWVFVESQSWRQASSQIPLCLKRWDCWSLPHLHCFVCALGSEPQATSCWWQAIHLQSLFPSPHNLGLVFFFFFNFYHYQFVKMTPQKNNRKMKTTISPSSMLSCIYLYFSLIFCHELSSSNLQTIFFF